jgi:hypothetical protein
MPSLYHFWSPKIRSACGVPVDCHRFFYLGRSAGNFGLAAMRLSSVVCAIKGPQLPGELHLDSATPFVVAGGPKALIQLKRGRGYNRNKSRRLHFPADSHHEWFFTLFRTKGRL